MIFPETFKPCAVIPCFNHGATLASVVERLRPFNLHCLVVDDGSDHHSSAQLDVFCSQADDVTLLRLEQNQGKGVAVMLGIKEAAKLGYTHVLQVDADGQHEIEKAGELLELAARHPDCLISGRPVYDASVPPSRLYGRYITHALVWVETLSLSIIDSMCGFRVYPVAASLAVPQPGARMDFDTEIMVRLYWSGTPSLFVPVAVIYPEQGISNFRMLEDNLLMARLHIRLLIGMVWRVPMLLFRRGRQSG
ncbi:glycosyltransferase family 2 protein [Marinospirillum sp.]|uniref:glycosyltransferase family 2 protein n=1 Tax=Marinospirillum sp. TaxID=2183934 RepID=UPI0025C0F6F6|nr:glycosyltransferase family 2 protein [Marinospirillum sp.]